MYMTCHCVCHFIVCSLENVRAENTWGKIHHLPKFISSRNQTTHTKRLIWIKDKIGRHKVLLPFIQTCLKEKMLY